MVSRLDKQPEAEDPERLFESGVVVVGAQRCARDDPAFAAPGPIARHVFVFPSVPVWVEREGEEAFLADPNLVTFHAEGDEIHRRSVDGRGDHCNWFAVDYDLLVPRLEAARHRCDAARSPFGIRRGPSPREAFLRQAVLVKHLQQDPACDPLAVEETALDLLDLVLASAFGFDPSEHARNPATRLRHARLVEAVKGWLAEHLSETTTLEQVARAVDASPFHLHRVFRAHAGRPLHAYRTQLRLRTAVAKLLAGSEDLTSLALSLGFASHSHFTDAFRRAFGLPPSALRERACQRASQRAFQRATTP